MKSNSIKNNFKSIAKALFLCLLALLMALGPANIQNVFADEQIGITWTRVNNETELYNALYDKNHTALNDNNSWKPILIVYKANGKWYYVQSGSIFDDDGDRRIRGAAVTATSGIDPDKDTFKCRTNCNSIFGKYISDDGGKHEYSFAYRNNGVSNEFIAMNMKWYGCQYASCCEGDFLKSDRSNPGAYADDSGACCSATCHTTWRVSGTSNNEFEIMWYTSDKTTNNRHWGVTGTNLWISRDGDNAYKDFRIYIGEESANAIQTTSSEVQPYSATKLCDYTIKSGVEIVVGEGACYVLDGENYNSGHIVVDGGTLVVRGLLDADSDGTLVARGLLDADSDGSSGTGRYGSYNISDIHIMNGGQLIVERSGVICNRNSSSGIYLSNNSSAYIEGTVVCASTLQIGEGCSLRAMPGSFIAIGCEPQSTIAARQYTADNIASNSSTYLSSLATTTGKDALKLGSNSSFISYGGVYIPATTSITYGNNSYSDAWFSTNINATLGSMMRQW